MNSANLYGKPLADWNRLAGLSGATQPDLEVAAVLHRCGHYRGYQRPNSEYPEYGYLLKEWDAMTASERLVTTFDLYAPCCVKKNLGRKRTVAEIMKDKAIEEAASVRVAGMTPKQLVQAIRPRVGWE